MKGIVLAVTRIDEDVQVFERDRIHDLDETDQERLVNLKRNCNGTLSNLMTAAKNHANSAGLSPVSLLDAAASHVAVTVVDIVKMLRTRPATAQEREQSSRLSSTASTSRSPPSRTPTNGSISSPVGNLRLDNLKKGGGSIGSTSSLRDRFSPISENGGRTRGQHGADRSLDSQSSFGTGRRVVETPERYDAVDHRGGGGGGGAYGSRTVDRGHYGRPSNSSSFRYSNRGEDHQEPNGRHYSSSPDGESEGGRGRYASSVGSVDQEVFDSPPGGRIGDDVSLEQGRSDEEMWEELKVCRRRRAESRRDVAGALIVIPPCRLPRCT
jgi:hypothetical protein